MTMTRRDSRESGEPINKILWPFVFLYILIALPFILLFKLLRFLYGIWLRFHFWLRWGRKGRFVLFVYSESPNWHESIETNVLPRLDEFAITLNWSQRSSWRDNKPLEAKIFSHWGGEEEFNPVAIVIPSFGRVKVVRFWQAFRDYKHGKEELLRKQEGILFESVHKIAGSQAAS